MKALAPLGAALLAVTLLSTAACRTASDDPPPWMPEPMREPGSEPQPEPEPEPEPVVRPMGPAPLPMMTGTILLSRDRYHLWVADPDRDRVWRVDTEAMTLDGAVTMPVGSVPFRMVEDSTGAIHVTLREAGALLTIDPERLSTVSRPACEAPRGLAYDPYRPGALYVACAEGELVAFDVDPSHTEPLRSIKLDSDLRGVVVTADRVFVTRFRAAEVLELDPSADFALVARYSPGSHRSAWEAPEYRANTAYRLLALPDGDLLMLHQWARSGPIATPPPVPSRPTGYYGDAGRCDSFVLSGLTRLRPGFGDVGQRSLQRPALASDVAQLDDESIVLLSAVDEPSDGFGYVNETPPAVEERGCEPMQSARGAGSAIAAAPGVLYTWRSEPPTIMRTSDVPRVTLVIDEASILADEGADLFHRRTPSGLTCGTCHPEGGDDGHVWDVVGVGPRRTQPLLGGLSAPFHWRGDMPSMSDIVEATFVERMGAEEATPRQAAAVQDWLQGLPPAQTAVVDPVLVEAGRAAFDGAGCASCHAGDSLSDEQTHDVGTGGEFNTPSLRGLPMRAPYFHDGCAANLTAVVDGTCGGEAHEVLDEAQRGLVIDYLSSL